MMTKGKPLGPQDADSSLNTRVLFLLYRAQEVIRLVGDSDNRLLMDAIADLEWDIAYVKKWYREHNPQMAQIIAESDEEAKGVQAKESGDGTAA